MDDRKEKTYVCGYSNCLHHGEAVTAAESVIVGKRHYHWDCAALKEAVSECVSIYVKDRENKSEAAIANKIIVNMVTKNNIPIEFIRRKIEKSISYYNERPVFALYGIRKLFLQNEVR